MSSSPVINKQSLIHCDRWFKKLRGLWLRRQDAQCLLYSCNCIHTFFFFRNIDVAFLNIDKQVIKIVRDMKPFRVSICKNAKYTFERFAKPEEDFLKINKKIEI